MNMELNEINKIFINNNILISMHIDITPNSLKYNLLISLSNGETTNEKISFYFYDISNMKINDVGGGLTQFMLLKISVVDLFNDRNKYIIEDEEDNKISFEFSSFTFLE
ncbi:hypothetical protein HMPREF0454_01651 [Hafnia alvei ATCC 51873]|uniref:Uncharacterized protein n=2 Tax=Hafnia alvei TaxID=569 RepID=G9Y513_HAFAL|nr:hypothetical protein HMPREF0454_01651 [Hafnia alvei ATCC 51873]